MPLHPCPLPPQAGGLTGCFPAVSRRLGPGRFLMGVASSGCISESLEERPCQRCSCCAGSAAAAPWPAHCGEQQAEELQQELEQQLEAERQQQVLAQAPTLDEEQGELAQQARHPYP